MKRLLTLGFFFAIHSIAFTQVTNLDLQYSKANSAKNDTAKVNGLNALAKHHINGDQDSGRFYVAKALELAEKLHYKKGVGAAKLTMGILQTDLGNYPEGLNLILEATKIAEDIKDYQLLAGCKLNTGNFYIKTGDTDKALKVYREGIEFCEKHGLYYTQASMLTSYGMGLKIKGDLDSALIYYEQVLEIHYNKLHDSVVIAAIYNNMAALHFSKGDLQTAENYLLESYKINKLRGNQRYMILNLSNLAELSGIPGRDFEKSKVYFNEAIELAKKTGAKESLESIYSGMSEIYSGHGKYKEAFEFLKISLVYKDSIIGEDKQAQIMEISEEFKTRQFKDSLQINQQQLEISNMNTEAANLRASQSTWQLLGSLCLLAGILVILFFVYRNSKNQKKINALLQEKNDEINHQKMEIEEKNTELTDSINYAKRIQTALLPSTGYLKKILGDHFLLFRPKDIVSGDFYWVKQAGNRHYFAVADCTGHGVPGAMVSMLGYETIEKISAENFSNAAEFINRINDALMASLSSKADSDQSENGVRDGMDLSMCIVTEKQKLSYCGANNECFIIRKNSQPMPAEDPMIKLYAGPTHTIIELKATKRPIGFYHAEHEFKNVELQLLRGDMFYLFSDGYADQFGGDKGKKMKVSTFREVLLENANLDMNDQLEKLEYHLSDWKGSFDQLDDITVLGVKVE